MKRPDVTLYLVTDRGGMEEEVFLRRIEDALRGGVTLLQLREKETGGRALYELAIRVKEMAERYHVPLIIDDRADIALAAGADGVHVGREDLPVAAARKLLGPDRMVGATAKTVEQAKEAERQGADYLGVGAIYPTTTKVKTVLTPVSTLAEIVRAVRIPVAAIGGLQQDNLGVLRDSGAAGIAVVSAIMRQEDTETAARQLRRVLAETL